MAGRQRQILGFLFPLLLAANAYGYECIRVTDFSGADSGPSLAWFKRTVPYTFYAGGTADVPGEGEFDALRDSFAVWEQLVVDNPSACAMPGANTDFDWVEDPNRSSVDRIGFNYLDPDLNENLLIFRDDGWPLPGQETLVIALATTTFNFVTGEILDADIEFNSANFEFSTSSLDPKTDIMNTAVHEIGHSMGIAHTDVQTASMFRSASSGELSKRDLACDDRDAMIFKYPSGSDLGYCSPAVSQCGFCAPPNSLTAIAEVREIARGSDVGGCSCATSSFPGLLFAALGGFLWARLSRRRRPV